VEEVPRLR